MAKAGRIRGLDGARGLAALAVLIHHTLISRTQLGTVAVDFFFVLSGFLIIGILHRLRLGIEARHTSLKRAAASFWIARVRRIFPAYYALLGIALVALWVAGQPVSSAWFYIAYLGNLPLIIGGGSPALGHLWSLAVEQQFYVLFSAMLLLLPSRLHSRALVVIAITSVATFAAMVYAGANDYTLMAAPTTAFVFLSVGGIYSISQIHSPRWGALVASAILMAMLATGLDKGATVMLPYWTVKLVSIACLPVIFASIVSNQHAAITDLLERRILLFLGAISYPLYLVHVPIMILAIEMLKALGLPSPAPGIHLPLVEKLMFFGSVASASAAAAVAIHYFIERPILKRKDPAPAFQLEAGSARARYN